MSGLIVPTLETFRNRIFWGDALTLANSLPDGCVNTIVTSPPYYGLRDYGVEGQIGLEDTIDAYVNRLVTLFRELRRGLRDDGTLWLNLGDSYANDAKWGGATGGLHAKGLHGTENGMRTKRTTGLGNKQLMGIPWRVAFALQQDGWILRQDIIWHKPAPMPESVKDRCTKAHEYVFLFAKSERYYFDNEAIKEPAKNWGTRDRSEGKYTSGTVPISGGAHGGLIDGDFEQSGKNKRSVWSVNTQPLPEAHFATFPSKLIEPMILAGSPRGGVVCDPFMGSGTTAWVARHFGRDFVGSELNYEYIEIAERRLANKPQIMLLEGAS